MHIFLKISFLINCLWACVDQFQSVCRSTEPQICQADPVIPEHMVIQHRKRMGSAISWRKNYVKRKKAFLSYAFHRHGQEYLTHSAKCTYQLTDNPPLVNDVWCGLAGNRGAQRFATLPPPPEQLVAQTQRSQILEPACTINWRK